VGRWPRAVGICDAPSTMHRLAASLLDVDASEVYLDYFGLNHLGWVRRVLHRQEDYLPTFLAMIRAAGGFPGLPFDPEFLTSLGMIPNEYLYYYYHARQAVDNLAPTGQTRGEFLLALNRACMADLERLHVAEQPEAMVARYDTYLEQRSQTYMLGETGTGHELSNAQVADGGGYARVALDLIETLHRGAPRVMILNLPNQGAVAGMDNDDVVEIPAVVSRGYVQPLAVGSIPAECLGLMQRVKAYERLTIEAAMEGSRSKALEALTLHPLVSDRTKAGAILSEFQVKHAPHFPGLE
jgi:6-phospho-beta-glucosidase